MAAPDGVVMGLDLGSRVAWAYGLPNGKPRSGAFDARERNRPMWEASNKLGDKLEYLFEVKDGKYRPRLLVFERPYIAGQKHAQVADLMVSMGAIVHFMCSRYAVECVEVSAPTVAKFCLDKGRWTKEEGGRAAKKLATQNWAQKMDLLTEDEVGDVDKADACMLWYYACHAVFKAPVKELFMFGEEPDDLYEEA